MLPSDPVDGKGQRLVEFIIGPCTRARAERFAQDMQEYADTDFPDLGAAVAIDFSPEQDTKSAPTSDRNVGSDDVRT